MTSTSPHKINVHSRRIAVVGLGYVGLQVAAAFGRHNSVIGFDIDRGRVEELQAGIDRTGEVDPEDLAAASIRYTDDPHELGAADFYIIAVPTPIDEDKRPVLDHLIEASRIVGSQLSRSDIVVYESTVYPGATEEVCVPVLEEVSGLLSGSGFFVGYSPERINPGDVKHAFTRIAKVVSAQDPHTLETIAQVYGSAVQANVHRAPSIKVAEAAKVIENTQRDLNIALMNEFALILDKLGIDTEDVLAAAGTKWNFLPFTPGLVGGHCVGVDPYYLTHKATQIGYDPQIILSGRQINDDMGILMATKMTDLLVRQGHTLNGTRVTVLGLSFKENVADVRNTLVVDLVGKLEEQGIEVQIHDPVADRAEAHSQYGLRILDRRDLLPADGAVVAVAHQEFVTAGWTGVTTLLRGGRGVVVDVQRLLDRQTAPNGVLLWRL